MARALAKTSAPWWLVVVAVFAASRVVTTTILLVFAELQQANPWTGARPSYWQFANLWDGRWYFLVAVNGYPAVLPRTETGQVAENAWAFMPLYPAVVEALSVLTGAPFPVVAPILSTAFALAAALMLYRVFALVLPESTALFAVTLFCFAPLSPILQVAYAESMHAFLLCLALFLLLRRQYGWLMPIAVLMAFTRLSGLAFSLALCLHFGYRFIVRSRDPFPVRERVLAASAAVLSGLAGLAWPAIAWARTGSLTAYTDTELAWRSAYIGYQELVPFTPWFQAAQWWMPGGAGLALLLIVLVGFAAAMFHPAVRRLGVDLRFWVASWMLYLLAVFFPQSSTFRLLLPTFPLLGALAQPRSVLWRAALLLAFVAGQVGWVWLAWWVDGYDWTPP